jgi:hypothetical protein
MPRQREYEQLHRDRRPPPVPGPGSIEHARDAILTALRTLPPSSRNRALGFAMAAAVEQEILPRGLSEAIGLAMHTINRYSHIG